MCELRSHSEKTKERKKERGEAERIKEGWECDRETKILLVMTADVSYE